MATAGIVSGRDSGMAGGVQTDGNQKGGPAENARALSSTRFFLAQYSGGACFGCPRRIVKNEPVCYVNGRLCHVECLEKVAQSGRDSGMAGGVQTDGNQKGGPADYRPS